MISGLTVKDLESLKTINKLKTKKRTKTEIVTSFIDFVKTGEAVDLLGRQIILGKRKREEAEDEENEKKRQKTTIVAKEIFLKNDKTVLSFGGLEFFSPIFCYIFDSKHLKNVFVVVKVSGIANSDEKTLFITESCIFESEIKPFFNSLSDFQENYCYSFYFGEINKDIDITESAQGDWEIEEMIPVTLSNLSMFNSIFLKNRKELFFQKLKKEVEQNEQTRTCKTNFNFPPSDMIELSKFGLFVNSSLQTPQFSSPSKSKKRTKTLKWNFDQECALIEIVGQKGKCKWKDVIQVLVHDRHIFTNMKLTKDQVRSKYNRLVKSWLKSDATYTRNSFVVASGDFSNDQLLNLELNHVKNEEQNEKRFKECQVILTRLEKEELSLTSDGTLKKKFNLFQNLNF